MRNWWNAENNWEYVWSWEIQICEFIHIALMKIFIFIVIRYCPCGQRMLWHKHQVNFLPLRGNINCILFTERFKVQENIFEYNIKNKDGKFWILFSIKNLQLSLFWDLLLSILLAWSKSWLERTNFIITSRKFN